MILTPPARLTDSEPGGEPQKHPRQGLKPCISRTASHLNHVPDTTCHIEGGAAGSGTAIAITTSRSEPKRLAKVKNQNARDLEESMGSEEAGCKTGHQAIE